MIERYIHHVRVEQPAPEEDAAAARVRLAGRFPRTALRRMTHLGLLLGSTLDGVETGEADALVYATAYAETRALEDFLSSFPGASPLLFQTSIHPGGIQQVLIGRQRPLGRLWPLAGCERLVEQALLTALIEPAERVVLAGGEERGTWMLERGVAAPRAFAFALVLTSRSEGAAGRVQFTPGTTGDDAVPTLETFAAALAGRHPLAWDGAGGAWSLLWT